MTPGGRILTTGCVTAGLIIAAAGAGWTWLAAITATVGLLLILRGAVDAITITGVVVVALLVWCWSAGQWHLLVPTASAGALIIMWLDDKEWKKHERK